MGAKLWGLRWVLIVALLLLVYTGLFLHTEVITSDWVFHATLIVAFITTLICGFFVARRVQPERNVRGDIFVFGLFMGGSALALVMFVFPVCHQVRHSHIRAELDSRMRQICKAMIAYADKHDDRLPPPAIYSKDGQPLLSWRVALLPYLGHGDLYRQFKLDEPWDSPHNLALSEKMPEVYALVGPGTAFEGKVGVSLQDFPDGTANTLLFAVAQESVLWTKPADMDFSPKGPVPELLPMRLVESGNYFAVMDAKRSRRFILPPITNEELRALITRNGGEPLPKDWNQ
jgi:hypothetical protein